MFGFGGLERLDWNGGMEWTGTVEWNGMEWWNGMDARRLREPRARTRSQPADREKRTRSQLLAEYVVYCSQWADIYQLAIEICPGQNVARETAHILLLCLQYVAQCIFAHSSSQSVSIRYREVFSYAM